MFLIQIRSTLISNTRNFYLALKEVSKVWLHLITDEDVKQSSIQIPENIVPLSGIMTVHQVFTDEAGVLKYKNNVPSHQGILSFSLCDLQQCLATPYLNTSVEFNKRKLWTFNFTVRNRNTGKTSCFMWHEAIAQRGADEIASSQKSCFFCVNRDPGAGLLRPGTTQACVAPSPHCSRSGGSPKLSPSLRRRASIYQSNRALTTSDTCPGQTRNNTLPVVYNYILTQKVGLKNIDHKFLDSGHTHLEFDADHASIEHAKKKYNRRISIPNDWYMLVRMVSSKFTVIELSRDDIFAFSSILKQSLIKKTKDQKNDPFLWRNIFWIRVEKEHPWFFSFKYSLRVEDEFKICDMKRKARASRNNQPVMDIRKAYNQPLLISKAKHKDIFTTVHCSDIQ
ncbi:unnamed protein product [Euphydryas editha]|uniref:Uncharacterized protein n=1 Tax=Euphydryas editha TaxID=104508 RepID=A0AAU9UMG5_EUPED|nr:unnamed protein product [Euphydryas editha]